MSEKPNVTVIYQEARAPGATFSAVLVELLIFLAAVGGIALLAGSGCMWLR
jgi:hypothetical protein